MTKNTGNVILGFCPFFVKRLLFALKEITRRDLKVILTGDIKEQSINGGLKFIAAMAEDAFEAGDVFRRARRFGQIVA